MELTAINIILAMVILLLCPVLVGNTVCGILKYDMSLSGSFLLGLLSIWGFCQLITVPLVFARQSFLVVVVMMCIFIAALVIYGLIKKYFIKAFPKTGTKAQLVAVICAVIAILVLIFPVICLQHLDEDDSRFVVNAVDIVRTNRMYLTNPATGDATQTWIGEIAKDVTSPWAVYIAFLSKVTGIQPTIMAHTFMPVMLLLAACSVFWLLSKEFFDDDTVSRGVFFCILIFLYIYGDYSRRSSERFMMVRIWQGKAVVASVGIPAMFLVAMWIYRNEKKIGNYILLCLLAISMCLMSGMGIIISIIMMGCIGFVYGIAKKSPKIMISIWAAAIPSLLFCVLNFVQG